MNNDCGNLNAYLDGDLAPGEHARFAAHLDDCPTCREAVDEQQWIDGLLRSPAITQLEPPPTLVESFRTSLARRFQYRFARLAAGGLAAAATILIAAGWMVQRYRSADAPALQDVVEVGTTSVNEPERSPGSSLRDRRIETSTFVSDSDVIVVPVASRSSDVTIVRIYPAYQPEYTAEADTADSTWTDSYNGG